MNLLQLEKYEEQFPKRTSVSSVGLPINVTVNVMPVDVLFNQTIYHYDVKFYGGKNWTQLKKELRKLFQLLLRDAKSPLYGRKVAFDGACNLYAREPLVDEMEGECEDERSKFRYKIVKAQVIPLSILGDFLSRKTNYTPHQCLQALEVIIKDIPSCQFTVANRSFFTESGKQIGRGLELRQGFYLSLKISSRSIICNADLVYSIFYQSITCDKMIFIVLRKEVQSLTESEIGVCSRALKNVKVLHKHLPRRKVSSARGLTRDPASRIIFKVEDEKISVVEYFKTKYGIELKYPNLPCIEMGSEERRINVPVECCLIVPNQKYVGQVGENETAEMIAASNKRPQERMKEIQKQYFNMAKMLSEPLKEFGIELGNEMKNVIAHVIEPPLINYDKSVKPNNGGWNLRGLKFFNSPKIDSFSIINFSNENDSRNLQKFLEMFKQTSQRQGMNLPRDFPPLINCDSTTSIKRCIEQGIEAALAKFNSKCQFLLILLPSQKNMELYNQIKFLCDVVYCIPSQCLNPKNLARPNPGLLCNILLKLNSKLGGINMTLGEQLRFVYERPTLVMGADVSHSVAASDTPSIAAICGSFDRNAVKYCTIVESQSPRQEVLENLKSMFTKLLKNFYQMTRGTKPERILCYRDGVSDGQFASVQNSELLAMKQACKELEASYNPKITFIIVQKRHRIRFAPIERKDSDKSGNVPSGTLLDTEITNPKYFDFYLCSHSGLIGTSRPVHYHVVYDDYGFEANQIQQITFQLCHIYARSTRTVSIPAPVYYAHLAAHRGNGHFKASGAVNSNVVNKLYFM
ncbi:Piwi-domain-containing protein [Rozella allomycis CSF55]|uniref:Piwi-domain-containing protein n=1 Tax=Rozella allomycis (strain CSF55) TaxID=988480 RepID=A0A4P9YGE8_ROZAC|nr:Piwi-domain-containing protein [Rozella allomycis CSF55]